ncbi:MAG: GNAT family N-acetyltransferase [Rudaea sp.]
MSASVTSKSADVVFPAITGDHWIEKLNDGAPVLIRPIRADDRERESDFIARLSPESRYFRFLGTIKQASPELLDQLVNVDFSNSMAFVALAHDDGVLREVGVSRYSRAGNDEHCECAVTVADDWVHRGLGVLLMRHLMDMARRNGFRQMFSIDAAENEPMQRLAKYLGFRSERDPDDHGQVIHTMDL